MERWRLIKCNWLSRIIINVMILTMMYEIFSPMTMLKFIQIMLAIAAHMDYEIWQMDMKIIFLNGELEEEVYMI